MNKKLFLISLVLISLILFSFNVSAVINIFNSPASAGATEVDKTPEGSDFDLSANYSSNTFNSQSFEFEVSAVFGGNDFILEDTYSSSGFNSRPSKVMVYKSVPEDLVVEKLYSTSSFGSDLFEVQGTKLTPYVKLNYPLSGDVNTSRIIFDFTVRTALDDNTFLSIYLGNSLYGKEVIVVKDLNLYSNDSNLNCPLVKDSYIDCTYSWDVPIDFDQNKLFALIIVKDINGLVNDFDFDSSQELSITYVIRPTNGDWLSPVIDLNYSVLAIKSISWTESAPAGTDVNVLYRYGPNAIVDGSWSSWIGPINNDARLDKIIDKFVQVKVLMHTNDPNITPQISNIKINYFYQE